MFGESKAACTEAKHRGHHGEGPSNMQMVRAVSAYVLVFFGNLDHDRDTNRSRTDVSPKDALSRVPLGYHCHV